MDPPNPVDVAEWKTKRARLLEAVSVERAVLRAALDLRASMGGQHLQPVLKSTGAKQAADCEVRVAALAYARAFKELGALVEP